MQRTLVLMWCIGLSGALCPAQAFAEKPAPVELSSTQIETNNRAVRLLSETPPKTKQAIKLVEAALLMEQQGDLLYLTLGRAYQLDGQCGKATAQFDLAESAPGVLGVPEDFVPGQLAEYRKDLLTCMGMLEVNCEPETLKLTIDDSPLACGTTVKLEPGSYKVDVLNPDSGDTLVLPVQISSGQLTQSTLKLGQAKPVETPPVEDSVEDEKPPQEAPSSEMSWRVAPYVGFGFTDNVLEAAGNAMVPPELRYVGDRSLITTIGVEGRVLFGKPALRYGVEGNARFESWPGVRDVIGVDDSVDLVAASSAHIGVHAQVWFSGRVGVYAGARVRPRSFDISFCDDEGDACDEANELNDMAQLDLAVSSTAFGGGLRLELGDLLHVDGLEVFVGWMNPTAGSASALDSSGLDDDDIANVPSLEAGLRAQIKGATIGFVFEGWHGEDSSSELNGRVLKYNLRAQQALLTFGWTFGG